MIYSEIQQTRNRCGRCSPQVPPGWSGSRGAKLGDDGDPIPGHQREIFPILGEVEICVQLRAGDAPVFSRCVDDEKTARRELNGRKPPPVQGLLFVGEVKAIEVNVLRAGIENLDPVRGVAITVQLRATIVR